MSHPVELIASIRALLERDYPAGEHQYVEEDVHYLDGLPIPRAEEFVSESLRSQVGMVLGHAAVVEIAR